LSASVVAYKFLARGAIGPVSRVPWPAVELGAWIAADGPVAMCRAGVHACLPDQLSFWLHEELWKVELSGELSRGVDCVIAPRGRLVERVEEWSEKSGAQRFSTAVRDHAASRVAGASAAERQALQGYVDDASWHVNHGTRESPALAALCASMAVAQLDAWPTRVTDKPDADALERAYRRERAWQSAWIVEAMGLG
jgi:hypothetical protein